MFVGLCVWLVRKAARAARTEDDLEGDRFRGALADELRQARERARRVNEKESQNEDEDPNPNMSPTALPLPTPTAFLRHTDTAGASRPHLALIAPLLTADVLWVHSTATHCVWCERRPSGDVVCIAHIESGAIVGRCSFG